MGSVDRNRQSMPVPSFAYVDRFDGRVFICKVEDGMKRRKAIGYMTDSTPGKEMMVPNNYFRDTYKELYSTAYPDEKIPFHEMSVGMYAATLGVGTKTGLYSDLQDNYGPVYANSILDYAMYSMLYRSGVTQLYEVTMEREVLFADRVYSDSWYSTFFSKKILEDDHHQFRIKWVQRLVSKGLKKVWLCIDGSNNDCVARSSFLAKFGFPKSHNANKTIVGYMYAVNGETGQPVTYFVYEGNVPDSQAFQKMATFLRSFELEIEGVILDRGFAVDSVFEEIQHNGWKYVIMLPGDTYAHTEMLKEYAETIRWKSQYLLDCEDILFGIHATKQLFKALPRKSDICLFFDGTENSVQSNRLIKQIQTARRKAEKAIANGKRAGISSNLRNYLSIEGEGSSRQVIVHYDKWDQSMSVKGYHSMAVSEGIMPAQAHALYVTRDTSETQYSIMKSQEGGHATRVHKTEGIYSKFALLFITSLIRHEIQSASEKLELDTNKVIEGLDHISLLYTAENTYDAVRDLSIDQKAFFKEFDMDEDDLQRIALEFNKRNKTDSKNPDRTLPKQKVPVIHNNTHRKGPAPSEQKQKAAPATSDPSAENVSKNKGGRPKGKTDSKPRKPRSDKGKPRGKRKQN